MALTITFNDEEADVIKTLMPLLAGADGQGVSTPKGALLIGLSVLIKARGCEIRTFGNKGDWRGQFNIWRQISTT